MNYFFVIYDRVFLISKSILELRIVFFCSSFFCNHFLKSFLKVNNTGFEKRQCRVAKRPLKLMFEQLQKEGGPTRMLLKFFIYYYLENFHLWTNKNSLWAWKHRVERKSGSLFLGIPLGTWSRTQARGVLWPFFYFSWKSK